ncbi:ThiF family adenylyltransferase [Mycoplana dimorpha]|uniref:ThiF family adenylyltransferase n=1 Tax=Mycoplana dimorpha TaxID=28320 RepID=UPI001AECE61B|nr:ThiF family adenylyltransferase [Mycoplana dimorpha]
MDIDAWFETLEGAFEGKLPDDHSLIRTFGGQGWRMRTMGVGLVVLADRDFPYSKPQAFVEAYDRKRPQPHIEPIAKIGELGRVCLTTPTTPNDPLFSVQAAVRDARLLLRANEKGEEDEDFRNDFGSYWSHYLPEGAKAARLWGLSRQVSGIGAFAHASDGTYYCFPDKVSLRRYSSHLWNAVVRDPHQFPIVELRKFPRPERFPTDTETLLAFLKRYTVDGLHAVGQLLRARPRRLPIVFSGTAPNGRVFKIAVALVIRQDAKRRPLVKAHIHAKLDDEEVVRLYDAFPLDTRHLDAALTRLSNRDLTTMHCKVVFVGCGALGSGIAMMLAKAGVTRFVLVDPEILGWENIRRHELGAEFVGEPKAVALKRRIERAIPDVEDVQAVTGSFQQAIEANPGLLEDANLVIAATGDWGCDAYLDRAVSVREVPLPTIYTWTEGFALATHAVLISGKGGHFVEGFDVSGSFKGKASDAQRDTPPECGNTTSPFGAVEAAQSQALAAKLALELLGGRHDGEDVWRTRTCEQSTLEDANGTWTEYWLESRGEPSEFGQISEAAWEF